MSDYLEDLKKELSANPIKVLDDGFVRLVDFMGSDEAVVQAARVSYGKGTKQVSEDRGLIRYLLRNDHTTPFEMCEIKLHIRVPMDCWRQWIRHRTANVNEYSTRYSLAIDAAQQTDPGKWRTQAKDNKQGSGGFFPEETGSRLTRAEGELQNHCRSVYNERIELGVSREQARKDLPLSTYTEAYWKIDLHNLLRFLRLRMDDHAQYEIRQYAKAIGYEIVSRWVPLTWAAFLDYQVNCMKLSDTEIKLLVLIYAGKEEECLELMKEAEWLRIKDGEQKPGREAREFSEKLTKLGIPKLWSF